MMPLALPTAVLIAIAFAYYALRALLIAGGASIWVAKSPTAERRRVYRRPFADGQLKKELKAAIAVVLFDVAALLTANHFQLLKLSAPTLGATALTFAMTFVWIEIWFYATHRA